MIIKMKAVEFFNSNNQHFHKLIKNAPAGLKSHQVEEAAVIVFQEIEDGLEINIQDIPRYVWKRAHHLNGKDYKRTWGLALNSSKTVKRSVERTRKIQSKLNVSEDEKMRYMELYAGKKKELKNLEVRMTVLSKRFEINSLTSARKHEELQAEMDACEEYLSRWVLIAAITTTAALACAFVVILGGLF